MTATPAVLHSVPTTTPSRPFPPGTSLESLVRYVPIKAYLTGPALASLIEVGSGARGVASIIDESFVGIDVRIDGEVAPHMYPFSYDGGRIPFQNAAFHTVVSMDTLEHVPAANRIDFLKELLRIAASRSIVAFATDTGQARVDDVLRPLRHKLGVGKMSSQTAEATAQTASVAERDDLGLPRARDIEAILNQLDDWTWRTVPAAGDFINLLVGMADCLPGAVPMIRPLLQDHAAELEAWILSGAFGATPRKIYLIERRRPGVPLVDLGNPATLINAITCPNCEGETGVVAPGVRCRGCGASFAPSADGTFRLHRAAISAPAGASPELTFALTPDWSNPDWLMVVHNYLHAFPASAPHKLWLTVDPRQQQTAAVIDMLHPLMTPFGARPFAEIFLSETPPQPGTALPLSCERARLFDYTSEWFRSQAQSAAQPRPHPTSGTKLYW